VLPYSSGGGFCHNPQNVEVLRFENPSFVVSASDYQLTDGRVHWVSVDGSTMTHGPSANIASVTRQLMCPEDIITPQLTTAFCTEQRQWAVNFSYEPVLGNKILTRGLSFYLEDEHEQHFEDVNGVGATIRDAFGTAINEWMASLQDHKQSLPMSVQQAVDKMISHSAHFALLTPPQVIQVSCKDTATFVIRYAEHDESQLINENHTGRKAARAEVAGRTLLINGVAYRCWKAKPQDVLFLNPVKIGGPSCYNLVPIFVHELGHAFGLVGHVDDPVHPSVMDSVLQPVALRPSAADAEALARVLMQPIQGTEAGRLDADGAGVQIPSRLN